MIIAEVVHGTKDPRKQFKTANIRAELKKGAYFCKTNYGHAVAVCIRPLELEVHIIGFDGEIYGDMLEISELQEIDKRLFLAIGVIINDKLIIDT